ncbi:MAG: amidohydrolase family protein [Candidatus Aminicenantes bacterium]|nr:amidohydrolase family protein [Candidatus Aminicenantes bacterium]
MRSQRKWLLFYLLTLLIFFCPLKAEETIVITNVKIIPIVGNDVEKGTIVIRGERIEEIGSNISIPSKAKIIDAQGLIAYPGMIDGYSQLGLSEISSIQATIDYRETGRLNPQVLATEALRPDSMHIPITRSNGITAALVAPSGGLISGRSGLIHLYGWTPPEMIVKSPIALHLELPAARGGFRRTANQPAEGTRLLDEVKTLFDQARLYEKRKLAASKNKLILLPEFDEKLEALLPVIHGELPLMISVHSANDIRAAIKFVQEQKVKAIFYGVSQGWMVAKEIAQAGIPVVFASLHQLPPSWEDGYDALYRNPGVLSKAGVKIAFSSSSASLAKELPYHAAKAVAFGLDKREALKAVTLYPAQIFGVDNLMGSLEKGKLANIVLAEGDLLELRTVIRHVFIKGQEIDLSSAYTEYLEKYKKRLEKK